jgi:hypothetical protein
MAKILKLAWSGEIFFTLRRRLLYLTFDNHAINFVKTAINQFKLYQKNTLS